MPRLNDTHEEDYPCGCFFRWVYEHGRHMADPYWQVDGAALCDAHALPH